MSDCIVPCIKFGGRDIVVWDCFSGVGLEPLGTLHVVQHDCAPVNRHERVWCGLACTVSRSQLDRTSLG